MVCCRLGNEVFESACLLVTSGASVDGHPLVSVCVRVCVCVCVVKCVCVCVVWCVCVGVGVLLCTQTFTFIQYSIFTLSGIIIVCVCVNCVCMCIIIIRICACVCVCMHLQTHVRMNNNCALPVLKCYISYQSRSRSRPRLIVNHSSLLVLKVVNQ